MTVQREALVAALRSSIEVSTSELEGKEEELAGARAEEATLNAVVHGTEAEIAAARSSLEALAPRVDSIVAILDEARGARSRRSCRKCWRHARTTRRLWMRARSTGIFVARIPTDQARKQMIQLFY